MIIIVTVIVIMIMIVVVTMIMYGPGAAGGGDRCGCRGRTVSLHHRLPQLLPHHEHLRLVELL